MRILTVLVLFAAVGALAVADVQHKETVRIVDVDDDGDRHEQVFHFDGEARPFLGVRTERADEGLVVDKVIADTAAERAGLRAGDVLVSIDGERLEHPAELMTEILGRKPGERVEIEILRDDRPMTIDAELGETEGHAGFEMEKLERTMAELQEKLGTLDLDFDIPDIDIEHFEDLDMPQLHMLRGVGKPRLGVTLLQPTPELREHYGAPADAGVIVSSVMSDMPAEEAGVRVGDIILSADGTEVEDAGDLIRALSRVEGDTVTLEILRDGAAITIDAYIPEPEKAEIRRRGPRA